MERNAPVQGGCLPASMIVIIPAPRSVRRPKPAHGFGILRGSRLFYAAAVAITFLHCQIVAAAGLSDAWEQAESFLFNDAAGSFRAVPAEIGGREREFGLALVMLNAQPQTDSNIQESLSVFRRLSAANPLDRVGILSRYFAGRVMELHLAKPDPKGALESYEELVHAHTGNPVAETAAAHIVALEVYGAQDPAGKLAELEALAPFLETSAGKRGFHYAMGYAYLHTATRSDTALLKQAVSHLKLAEAEGMPRWQDRANLMLSIAETSRLLDERDTAAEYYRRFVSEFKRDSRNFYARQRLAALTQGATNE